MRLLLSLCVMIVPMTCYGGWPPNLNEEELSCLRTERQVTLEGKNTTQTIYLKEENGFPDWVTSEHAAYHMRSGEGGVIEVRGQLIQDGEVIKEDYEGSWGPKWGWAVYGVLREGENRNFYFLVANNENAEIKKNAKRKSIRKLYA